MYSYYWIKPTNRHQEWEIAKLSDDGLWFYLGTEHSFPPHIVGPPVPVPVLTELGEAVGASAIYPLLHRISWLQGAIASAGARVTELGADTRLQVVGEEAWFLRPAIVALGSLASRHLHEFLQLLQDDPRAAPLLAEMAKDDHG